jgi:hypothetical protein
MRRTARHEIIACLDDAVTRLRVIADIAEHPDENKPATRLSKRQIAEIHNQATEKLADFEDFTGELRSTS